MKTKTFFGKKATLNQYNSFETEYEIKFNSFDEVVQYYDEVKTKCHTRNFGLNPFESNAYGEFVHKGISYILDSPYQANGDQNWYEYPKDSKRIANIRVMC